MGKALSRVFHQEEALKGIEEQPASVSYLMSPVRRTIFLHLCANPCDHVRGTARAVGKSPHTTSWHLNRLCEVGYLDFAFVSRKRVFWPKGMLKRSDADVIALLRKPELVKVLAAVAGKKDTSENELISKLKVKQQNLNVWLKLLCASKVLKKTGYGRGTTYGISPGFVKILGEYKSRARKFSETLLKTLEKDGLRPKKQSFVGSVLRITVSLPSGSEKLRLECNPFAALSRLLK
jgi:hypothetical protein